MNSRLNSPANELESLSAKPELSEAQPCKVGIVTLGCKVNRYDSAALEEDLLKRDFSLVPFNSIADIYIINTCTVTALADFQSRQLIRRAHKMNPQAKILVTGCSAQIAPADMAAMEGVTTVVGNDMKDQIAGLLKSNTNILPQILTGNIFQQKIFCPMPIAAFGNRSRAYLKIQDGCNSFCSYCLVPFARGNSRSMAPVDVCTAFDKLSQTGYQEIVLTGIHLGLYGHDLEPATNLSAILPMLLARQLNTRIRLSSIEPREVTADLLHVLQNNDLLCPHLHIPLQSGDDRILQLMKRDYNGHFFRNLIEKVCSTVSDIAIGVDVMVGFPTESEEQFNNTLRLLEELPLAYLHVFPYSARPGTAAQKLQPPVPQSVKKERAAVLRNLSLQKKDEYALRFLGKQLKVLIESDQDKKTGLGKGFSQNYLPFLLEGNISSAVNKIMTIRAEKYLEGKLYGRIASC